MFLASNETVFSGHCGSTPPEDPLQVGGHIQHQESRGRERKTKRERERDNNF